MPQWTVFVRQNLDRHLLLVALLAGLIVPIRSAPESSLGAYLAGAAGLIAVHERLRMEFPRGIALITTLLVFGGTSLFWSMTRAVAFVESAAFGLVAALLMVSARLRIGQFVVCVLIAATPLALQYLTSNVVSTSVPTASVGWESQLFSSSRGFLSLTPIAFLALLGTIASLRRHFFSAFWSLGLFVSLIAINSVAPASMPIDGPSGHRLTAALAILAPGLAFLIDRARARPMIAVIPLIAGALLWNYWLMVQYTIGTLPKDAPVSFGDMVRQQAEVHTRPPYVYLFAFPANAWFAWREGVPAARYELLAPEPRRESIDLVMDRYADRFLLEGWDAPGPDAAGPVHWIGERRATIALPLDLPDNRPVLVSVTARARLEEPAVDADLGLEVNGQEIGRFVAAAKAAAEATMTVPTPAVGRIFRAGYNRLTLVSYGVHRADAADRREPGPIASRTGRRAWPVAISRIRIRPESTP